MNDFKNMIIDNNIFKIALAIISVVSIIGILFNIRGLSFLLFLYVPMSMLYCNMYKQSKISTSGNITTFLNTAIFVISYPGYLLYLLVKFVLTAICSIAKATTYKPKFKYRKRKK